MGLMNFLLLQWVFIRLTKNERRVVDSVDTETLLCVEYGPNYKAALPKISASFSIHKWYSVMYWTVPLSGYFGKPYRYLWCKCRYLKLTKAKIISKSQKKEK